MSLSQVTMTGADLKAVLEDMVSRLCPDESCYPGTFLQMSGVNAVFDIYEDNVGSRLTFATVS